jgi:hypothetical protein
MKRRNFIKVIPTFGAATLINYESFGNISLKTDASSRDYWLNMMIKICDPVIDQLSKGLLKKNMPVETGPNPYGDRKDFAYLEAFGRTLAGIGPWLGLKDTSPVEGKLQQEMIKKVANALAHATDPKSPDYMNWINGTQPLVDTAFLVHGMMRSNGVIWNSLTSMTQKRLIEIINIQKTKIKPWYNNWLLFGAMIDAFLIAIGEDGDLMRMDYAIKKHQEWYLGDGWYGDGAEFHLDYYNGYVIQSMMKQVLDIARKHTPAYEKDHEKAKIIMTRHALQQERMISPEGTYPPLGRSLTYRIGAFQTLSDAVLHGLITETSTLGQIKGALSAVLKNQFEAKGTFNDKGWLQIGFCGHQPGLADEYVCTGSLYLCSTGFLHLGLSENHAFWTSETSDWTSKKAWQGIAIAKDNALKI